ncbi:DNA-directed RNA polymerase III subunit RPC11 [Nematocida sp. LUAm3]|nr:DNA-directed RNA polymerase III subunit RPC11 [Nematocida sp. LUAm3]KAI5175833.1 DNA-directed RNA polymerase III subunit RPC11 [Nematocida sp. LUAm2]KAI5178329.1 DNA-directed RNA polymerase III subunit RPC11 [Nematocida sp. LUAm1]
MPFCRRCLSELQIEKAGGVEVFFCLDCPYRKEIEGEYRVKLELTPKEEATVSPKRELPERNVPCPSCFAGKAYYYQMQTRSADEPMTIFNICVTCKHSWRE